MFSSIIQTFHVLFIVFDIRSSCFIFSLFFFFAQTEKRKLLSLEGCMYLISFANNLNKSTASISCNGSVV